MPDSFLGPANQLTYFFAIPAMLFRAIAKSDFKAQFDWQLVVGTLIPVLILFLLTWIYCLIVRMPHSKRGTFIDAGMHGNIGYIGLAVIFYYLGPEALSIGGILAGFLMIAHNALAVISLQIYSATVKSKNIGDLVKKIIGNPVILTSLLGILYSLTELPLPVIIDNTLTILGNLALPLALLVIGASLSFNQTRRHFKDVLILSFFKLLILPALGLLCYQYFGLSASIYLPGLVLLMMPIATVVYILSSQLKGDENLAVASISASTAFSAVSISLWLSFVNP